MSKMPETSTKAIYSLVDYLNNMHGSDIQISLAPPNFSIHIKSFQAAISNKLLNINSLFYLGIQNKLNITKRI